ncbi:MAG: serine/threonine protein kinase [Rhodopirellula sp.]|nr:serine/threonine protein kinase [Rhodopirellula sp.]
MSDRTDGYPTIILSGTDPDLPDSFSNDFSKYTDFKELARGGNALLRSCWDAIMGRKVALKTLLPKASENQRERRRFLREARVTAQLAHPATVPVYEIGKTEAGELYFTMKCIAGENLFKILQRLSWGDKEAEEEYPLHILIDMLIQASQALAYAHVHGVIHRDVKPENIWIGKFGEVVLLDWGVAKVWGQSDKDAVPTEGLEHRLATSKDEQLQTLTLDGQRPGTPLYMSPEAVLGHRNIDERTDIFSFGVLMYEMLTFSEPFRGPTIRHTFDNIINFSPPPLQTKAPSRNIPEALNRIVLKAIEKEPDARYQSMLDMIDDLRATRHELLAANQ